jgi:hypothetical protein
MRSGFDSPTAHALLMSRGLFGAVFTCFRLLAQSMACCSVHLLSICVHAIAELWEPKQASGVGMDLLWSSSPTERKHQKLRQHKKL